jgi:hypothetical protein
LPAPKKYRNTTPFLFNAELDRFNEFKELCHKEKKSVQEKLNELIIQTIETDGIGKDNPLGITYGPPVQQKITSFNAENPLETLDLFTDNGVIGLKQWQPAFAQEENQERIDKYANLITTMDKAVKAQQAYLKTSRRQVLTGKEVHPVPQMKGTRTGF